MSARFARANGAEPHWPEWFAPHKSAPRDGSRLRPSASDGATRWGDAEDGIANAFDGCEVDVGFFYRSPSDRDDLHRRVAVARFFHQVGEVAPGDQDVRLAFVELIQRFVQGGGAGGEF